VLEVLSAEKRESFLSVEGLLEALSIWGLSSARLPPSPPSDRHSVSSTESGVDAAAPKRKMTATRSENDDGDYDFHGFGLGISCHT